jgi:hypothetical protein
MPNMPFTLPTGMVSDDTVFAAPGRWRRGSWVRFWEGSWQIKGGFERFLLDNLGGVCRTVFGWQDQQEITSVAFGLHNGLKYWQSGTFADITPAAFVAGQIDGTGGAGFGTGAFGVGNYSEPSTADYFPLTWSLAAYGGDLMANPRGQTIFQYTPGDPLALPLAGAPARVTFMRGVQSAVHPLERYRGPDRLDGDVGEQRRGVDSGKRRADRLRPGDR